jgi:CRISPR/Cas system CSM-associated protein Csm3 (group 7 of RAMP superfamily)
MPGEQTPVLPAEQAPAIPTDPDVRIEYTLTLRARTALHLGAATGDLVADLALARDGFGRCYVPGTSWGGVLRHLAQRIFENDVDVDIDDVFGRPPKGKDAGHASRVFVDDTPIDGARVELRTGVGIDRVTGAAADRIRYDREVLPPGSTVTLRLRYEGPDDDSATVLGFLVAAVRCDGIRVGAGTRRGLGLLSCEAAQERRVDLRSRQALLDEIAGELSATPVEPMTGGLETLRIRLGWHPTRPVVVGGSAPGEKADLVPLLTRSADGAGLVPVLPGSAVKGVLRGTAERILRTVLDGLAPPGSDFVAGLDGDARAAPVLEALFGSRNRAGAVAVPDIVADVAPVPTEQWAGYLAGAGSPPAWGSERTHVAIDRWTGGAADQQLFTVQETTGVRWPALAVELDLGFLGLTLPERQRRAAVVLLGLAVAALIEGTAGLGGGTTRGLGEIEVTSLDVDTTSGFPDWSATSGADLAGRWWQWLAETAPDGGWVAALPPRKEVD